MSKVILVSSLLPASMAVQAHSLPDLVKLAIESHPSVMAARAGVDEAQAGVETAEWQYYPTTSFTIENAAQGDDSMVGSSTVSTLAVQQPLWTWGQLDAGVGIASQQVKIARSEVRQQQWALAEQVIEAYGLWYSSYQTMLAWRSGLDVHEMLLSQVENRVAQGVSAQIDLSLASGRVASTYTEYLAAVAEADIAKDELSELIAAELSHQQLNDHLILDEMELSNRDILMRLAQNIHPEIELARGKVQWLELQIIEQQAAIKPSIYLRAEHQLDSFTSANAGSQTRVYIGMSGNSGAGLAFLSQGKGAQAKLAAQRASLKAELRRVQQRIQSLTARLASLQSRIESLSHAMSTTRAVSESYNRQFLAGRKSWQEVMNSAREQVQMQVQLVDLQSANAVAMWRLNLYTNGLHLAVLNRASREG